MLSFLIKSAQNLGKDILAIISRCKGNKKKGNTKLFRLLIAIHYSLISQIATFIMVRRVNR